MASEKRDNLIIWKESENGETPPYVVASLYVLFVLAGKLWSIQEEWGSIPPQALLL